MTDPLPRLNSKRSISSSSNTSAKQEIKQMSLFYKPPSRSNSQLIQAFTQAKHEMQNEVDKQRLAQLVDMTAKRKNERESYFPQKEKEKEKTPKPSSNTPSEKYKQMDEHKITLDELYKRLKVDPNLGLSSSEADIRNRDYGDNALTAKKKSPWYMALIHQLTTLFACLLWLGAILSFLAYGLETSDISNLYLGIVLIVVNCMTALVTYFQNAKSEAIIDAFKNFVPPKCKVLRGGNFTTIDAAKLVPGDIVELKGGDRIPADMRVIFAQEMKVDNSSLTGESDALLRTLECTNKENPLETDNLCFFGTLCKEGIGKGIVIQIGDNTVIGQIAHLASTAGTQKTPLKMEIDRFILIVIAFAFTCGTVFFVVGIIVGYKIIIDITFAIGVLVGTVPEGLLATVTAALTLTAKRLATKKVLVKNLEAVETLGSTSCICSDKTGTLTQNRMTVEHMWYDGTIKRGLNYQKFGPDFSYEYDLNSSGFKNLHENAMLCSEAVFDNTAPKPDNQNVQEGEEERQKAYEKELAKIPWLNRPAIGDASETALIRFYQAIEDIKETRNKYPIRVMEDKSMAKIPFNSAWKYAVTICEYSTTNSDNCIFIKGAPEKIWQLCSNILINDHVVAIDDHWRKQFQQVNRTFGEGGERVLGFAKLHLPKNKYPADFQFNCKNISNTNFPHEGFTFTGLISLIDPPREVVPFSILKCKTAGVKVIMVTGDQPVTAAAIARQVNIFQKDEKTVNQIAEEKNISFEKAFDQSEAIVIHGDMITQATQEDDLLPESEKGRTLAKWLSKPRIVFARTTPAQKLIIVKGCQAQGHIVAVTGDGVNDSPAIKKADIGIAMGVTGSDVAKDAADMILLTDDFSAIILGIEEGRKIFDNLKKSIIYCTSINIPQLLPFLAFLIFGFPVPITPILMLCVDIGTDVIPAIAFAAEEAELGIMLRPPRRKTEHMVNSKLLTSAYAVAGLFEAMGGFLTYFVIMRDFGFPILELFNLVRHKGFYPIENEVYDPTAPYHGNNSKLFQDYCNACWADASKCDIGSLDDDATDGTPDWIHNSDKTLDMRLFYLRCSNENGVKSIYSEVNFGSCNVKQVSEYSGAPVCYTSESVKFAQTAYFISIVFAQISNAMSVKSRKFSFMFSGLTNFLLVYGFASEICLTLLLTFANPFHSAFNTRELTFLHYGIPAIPFSVLALFYNEIRKFLIRNTPSKDPRKPNWWIRNTYW